MLDCPVLDLNERQVKVKDTLAELDYALELEDELRAGDAIDTHNVTPDAGLTLESSAVVTTQIVFWLSGGADTSEDNSGTDYNVRLDWTTAQGRTDGLTVVIKGIVK